MSLKLLQIRSGVAPDGNSVVCISIGDEGILLSPSEAEDILKSLKEGIDCCRKREKARLS